MTQTFSRVGKAPLAALLGAWLAFSPVFATGAEAAPSPTAPAQAPRLFATVAGEQISAAEFDAAFNEAFRRKFYHGQPPDSELRALMKVTGEQLIIGILMDREIARRNIAPDTAAVEQQIQQLVDRYKSSQGWEERSREALPKIREKFSKDSRREVLERQIRNTPEPSEAALRKFYDENPKLFTEPEQVRVSTILLRLDPSSNSAVVGKAFDDAKAMVAELRGGADFAAMARARSGDTSAANGGDMGFLHRGQLSADVDQLIDTLETGKVSDPLRVLEGVAIFRVDDRKPARLRSFDDVRKRASDLLRRQESEAAWAAFLKDLRANGDVVIEEPFRSALFTEEAKTSK